MEIAFTVNGKLAKKVNQIQVFGMGRQQIRQEQTSGEKEHSSSHGEMEEHVVHLIKRWHKSENHISFLQDRGHVHTTLWQ
jgi:hypothetical protein